MNTFFKIMTAAIDVLLAVTLGMEIKDRIDARKKNITTPVTEPVTED